MSSGTTKQRTVIEQLLEVLPEHAHITHSLFVWRAEWTTPRGLFRLQYTYLVKTGVQIDGPGVVVALVNPDMSTILGTLRIHGAIEPATTEAPLTEWEREILTEAARDNRGEPDSKQPTRGIGGKPSDESILLDEAWGVIAAGGIHKGGWEAQHPEWVAGAIRWRDRFHAWLSRTPLAEYDEAVRLAEANRDGAGEPVVAEDADPGRPACETPAGCDGNDCVGPACDKHEAPSCPELVNGKPCRKRADHRGSCQPKLAQGGIVPPLGGGIIPPPDGAVRAVIVMSEPGGFSPVATGYATREAMREQAIRARSVQGGGLRA